jgi:hypothetical protein
VPSPFVAGKLTPHVAVLLDYAHNPLVIRTIEGNQEVGKVVSSQLFIHGNATLALFDRVAINVEAPAALVFPPPRASHSCPALPMLPFGKRLFPIRNQFANQHLGEYMAPICRLKN